MVAELYIVIKVSSDLYVLIETESVNCYLILGEYRAVLFDLGYGYTDIMPVVREITDLPVMPVLSHGDPDHGLGASYFEEIWMHELDYGKLLYNDTRKMRKTAMDYRLRKCPRYKEMIDTGKYLGQHISIRVKAHFLRDGDQIDIGGRKLEVLHTPGHSYGHIMLLDRKKKRLFSGDQVTAHNIWYFGTQDEQAPFEMARSSLRRIAKEREWVESIYPAHDIFPIGMEYVDDQLECLSNELHQNYANDKKFVSFMGEGRQHFYKSVNLIYSDQRLAEDMGFTPVREEESR